MLNQRDREIDGEIARLEALKAEKEVIRREISALNAALTVFGERESATYKEVETELAKASVPLEEQDAVLDAKGDSSQNISEANTIPESSTIDSDRQRSIARTAKAGQNGKPLGIKAAGFPEFNGNKTDFVRALVQSRGAAGATPKEIDQVFTERRIEKSKNAIYNALDSLLRQKKLRKKDGQYFYVASRSD